MNVSWNKRRGISNVVTTALMLTAVAVIGTGVVVWSNSNLKTYEINLSSSASTNTNKINEMPVIENVVLVPYIVIPPQKYVNVTVTNVGTIGFNVTSIKISDSTNSLTFTQTNGGIRPHTSKLFAPLAYQWKNGYVTTIQVTTGRGSIISTQAMTP